MQTWQLVERHLLNEDLLTTFRRLESMETISLHCTASLSGQDNELKQA
jgi:hypothetical protein